MTFFYESCSILRTGRSSRDRNTLLLVSQNDVRLAEESEDLHHRHSAAVYLLAARPTLASCGSVTRRT